MWLAPLAKGRLIIPQVWGSSPHPGTSRTNPAQPVRSRRRSSHLRQTHLGPPSRPRPGRSRSLRAIRRASPCLTGTGPPPRITPNLATVVKHDAIQQENARHLRTHLPARESPLTLLGIDPDVCRHREHRRNALDS